MILVYSIQRWTTTKHWQKQSNMTRWITFIHSIDHWHMSTVCVTHVNWSTDMRRTHCPLLYCRHVMTWLQRYAVVFSRSFFSVPCTSQTTAYGTVGRHNTLHSCHTPTHPFVRLCHARLTRMLLCSTVHSCVESENEHTSFYANWHWHEWCKWQGHQTIYFCCQLVKRPRSTTPRHKTSSFLTPLGWPAFLVFIGTDLLTTCDCEW